MDESTNPNFFLREGVEKGCRGIRERIDQRLNERVKKWADVYSDLRMDKARASRIRNGIIIPPQWLRIKIAERLEIDSSVIWNLIFPDKKSNPIVSSSPHEGEVSSEEINEVKE